MAWTFAGGPWNAGPEFELGKARGKSVTWRRGDVPSLKFDLPGTHRAARFIVPKITDIWLQQDAAVIYRGRISPNQGGGTATKTTRAYSAVGYKGALAGRLLFGPHVTWSATNPGDAAWQIIQDEQARPGSDYGITRGPVRTETAIASFNVDLGQPLNEALDTLAKLGDGADWDITPVSLEGLQFGWWPISRGVDRGITIEIGRAPACAGSSFTDQLGDGYGNAVRLTGKAPEGGDAPAPLWVEAPDIATRPEGRWDVAETTEQTSNSGLAARGVKSIAEHQQVPISWTCKLKRGWWEGPGHLFIGDPFTWVCRAPGYSTVETQVVEELTADFTKSNDEPEVSISFGAPAPTSRFQRRKVNQSLAALARR